MKNGDFPITNGDFPIKNGDFPIAGWFYDGFPEGKSREKGVVEPS